jgi:tetratricopeptide (TPR) repeat protein
LGTRTITVDGLWGAALVFVSSMLLSAPVFAQPVRTRILDHLSIHEDGDTWEVEVAFSNAIRYLRHSPLERGRSVHIQLENIAVSRVDSVSAFLRESLRPPPDAAVPIVEVVYDGDVDAGPSLDVRFTRDVKFWVRQGADFRSLTIAIVKDRDARRAPPVTPGKKETRARSSDAAPTSPVGEETGAIPQVVVDLRDPYALQLFAAPETVPLPELPPLPVLEKYRLYATPYTKDGEAWHRLRLGFFATEREARAVERELEADFPDVWVVETQRGERVASAAWTIQVRGERPRPPSRRPAAAASPEVEEEAAGLMERGRDAMTAGDLALAIGLFTKVLTLPENERSPEAIELLGLARERNGQLAHAKAEYEKYLERYPEGEGADRVRQRLQAMLTGRKAPKEDRRRARAGGREWSGDVYGSFSVSYLRAEQAPEAEVLDLVDSSIFSSLNVTSRLRSRNLDFMARAAADYRYDLERVEVFPEEFRATSLFLEATHRSYGVSGTIGRQSMNTGGVLGRFDGIRLSWAFYDEWTVGAVAGFPLDFSPELRLDTSKRFAGFSLDTPSFLGAFQGQIFAIGQTADGIVDRVGVGGELRYTQGARHVVAFVDYDAYYAKLNTALLVGNWPLGVDTDLNFTLDYRNSPILTTSNALIGQTATELRFLLDELAPAEIETLALQRTARSMLAAIGATHRMGGGLQISGDFALTELTGTPEGGGVAAVPGTGLEFNYGSQLIANGILSEGDVSILGLRIRDGNLSDVYTLNLNHRLPLSRGFRLNPRLTLDYRDFRAGGDGLFLRPSLRVDWRVWKLFVDAEAGFDWIHHVNRTGPAQSWNEYGYLAQAGFRLDF